VIEIDPQKQLDLIHSEVNTASSTSMLKSFFQLFAGITIVLLCGFFILFVVAEFVVELMPATWEDSIHETLAKMNLESLEKSEKESGEEDQHVKTQAYIQELVDQLKMGTRLMNAPLTVRFVHAKEANAWAVPGYKIIVTEGLYKDMESENELAMILAHELGHFDLRHIMKNSARALVILFFTPFLSQQQGALSICERIANSLNTGHSRGQEEDSDRYALELIADTYNGNSAGVVDFFQRLSQVESKVSRGLAYLSTHPSSGKRVKLLKQGISELGLTDQGKTPLRIKLEKAEEKESVEVKLKE
jgi:beta-barrel assembly-enhancing protease